MVGFPACLLSVRSWNNRLGPRSLVYWVCAAVLLVASSSQPDVPLWDRAKWLIVDRKKMKWNKIREQTSAVFVKYQRSRKLPFYRMATNTNAFPCITICMEWWHLRHLHRMSFCEEECKKKDQKGLIVNSIYTILFMLTHALATQQILHSDTTVSGLINMQ